MSEVGTVQGGSISPLLANIYLHYVFDLWVQRWRERQARGDVDRRAVCRRLRGGLPASRRRRAVPGRTARAVRAVRTGAASREDAADRVRPLCGRRTGERAARGNRRPSTSWASRTSAGRRGRDGSRCCGGRCASGCRRSCRRSRVELRRRMHAAHPGAGRVAALGASRGHIRYYGVPTNGPALIAFRPRGRPALARTLRAAARTASDLGPDARAHRPLASPARVSVIPTPFSGLAFVT